MSASRTRLGMALAAVLLLLSLLLLQRMRRAEELWSCRFPVMGTAAAFHFYTAEPQRAERAAAAARQELEKVVRIADFRRSDSELARLNAAAGRAPFRCSPELWFLLTEARRAWQLSGGRFDVTVKPLMDLWGFYRKRRTVPSHAEIAGAKRRVGMDKLLLEPETKSVRFLVPGMALDLGGIAKGYAADRAAEAAVQNGIRAGVVDIGGNLRLLPGLPPGKKSYSIRVRDPRDPAALLPGRRELPPDRAVATSGSYERFVVLEGKRYGHIVSPLTGCPEPHDAVTVVTRDALHADWLSTSLYLGGRGLAEKLRDSGMEFRFLFVPEQSAGATPAAAGR